MRNKLHRNVAEQMAQRGVKLRTADGHFLRDDGVLYL